MAKLIYFFESLLNLKYDGDDDDYMIVFLFELSFYCHVMPQKLWKLTKSPLDLNENFKILFTTSKGMSGKLPIFVPAKKSTACIVSLTWFVYMTVFFSSHHQYHIDFYWVILKSISAFYFLHSVLLFSSSF